MHRITYGLFSIGILWACAGGEFSLFWSRQLTLLPIFLILGLATVWAEKKLGILKPNSASLMMGLGLGTLALVGFLVFLSFSSPQTKDLLRPTGLTWIFASVVLIATQELLYRGLLQPLWGLWSCAFLEAINFGFGAQSMSLFLLVLLSGALAGFLSKRFGFVSGLYARSLIWLGCFIYLYLS